MKLRTGFSVLALLLFGQSSLAKDWREIVPLKSTRADVERRFGKPDKWGNYGFKDEQVSFEYGDGPCKGLYLALGEDNCKCLVDTDTVMSVFVEPTVKRKISDLKLDMKDFKRTPITPFPHTFEYDNTLEGITYTVDESEDEIKHITYYPSPVDCQDIISKRASLPRNSWRGLLPLRSNRKDVEALAGSHQRDGETSATYETDSESIVAKYSDGHCDATSPDWNAPKGTLIELIVNPNPSFLLQELHLELQRYERHEIFPYPEIDNPPKVWNYIDNVNGITIRAQSNRGGEGQEVVVSITYRPAKKDEKLLCTSNAKSANTKP
jgi:hypothetical protein